MSVNLKFDTATVRDIALAKVGNKNNGELLVTSEALCSISGENEEVLTEALLKRFKNLERKVFFHPEDLEQNIVFSAAKNAFNINGDLLAETNKIVSHLYESTKDPSVKAGELCVATIEDVAIDGSPCKALCIVKSESSFPVLEISEEEEGLDLKTHNVIFPDKMQKGALIVAYQQNQGFAVYSFDKSAGDLNGWERGFLGIKPLRDESFMTKKYTDMAINFAQEEMQAEEVDQVDRFQLANQAMVYFEENDEFDLKAFEQSTFSDNEDVREQFQAFKEHYKDEDGTPLDENFSISRPEAKKALRKVKGVMNLNNGATITFKPQFAENLEESLEKGYDEERQMKYVKLYYTEEM